MLPWLVSHFEIPKPLLLIRHPCAVLSSWLNRGWRLNQWIKNDPGFISTYPELEPILKSLKHDEEYFAARWCVDYYVPLAYRAGKPFNIVPFEKLVVDGTSYLAQVLSRWDIDMPPAMSDEIRRPSERASGTIAQNYESVLNGWQSSLTKVQIDRVLSVVKEFGLDFYSRDVEPDYERLLGPEPIRSK